MALDSTHPLTEMSTTDLPGCKERTACKADNLTAICESIIWKTWEPRRLTTLWASAACYGDSFIILSVTETLNNKYKLNSVALVRKQNIPTERPPFFDEVSDKFCG
jgi:hypothetical protein